MHVKKRNKKSFQVSQLLEAAAESFYLEQKATFLGSSLLELCLKLLLLPLDLLSTSYFLINDPDPDIQTINGLPTSALVEPGLKTSRRSGNAPPLSPFLAPLVFPPRSESPLVFAVFSDVFQLDSWQHAGNAEGVKIPSA